MTYNKGFLMKTFYACLVIVIGALLLSTVVYASKDAVQLSGNIVTSPASTAQTTIITPQTTGKQTSYTVYSTVTGKPLATFQSLSAATAFVAQLNPTVPYTKLR